MVERSVENRTDAAAAQPGGPGSLAGESEGAPAKPPRRTPARFVRRQVRRARKLALCGEGFSLKGANTWIKRTSSDRRHRLGSAAERRWAHGHGFSVAQVERFGVTSDNVDARLSERDYDFLCPLNGKYGKWLDDRVTARLVAGPLRSRLEQMHFNVISRNGELLVVPLSAEAQNAILLAGGGSDFLVAFLRENPGKQYKLVGSAWSSRQLNTLALRGGTLFMDDEPITEARLNAEVRERANRTPLVLFEPAPKDATLAGFGDELVGSVRLLVGNLEGTGPEVLDAYMRVVEPVENEAIDFDALDRDDDGGTSDQAPSVSPAANPSPGEPADETLVVHYYACPIALDAGTYKGGRAMLSGGDFLDVDATLVRSHALSGSIAHWDEIKRDVAALFARMPQIEFAEVSIRSGADAWRIVGLNSTPTFNRAFPLPERAQRLLKAKVQEKRELCRTGARQRVNHAAFLRLRRRFTRALYPKNMVFYQGLRYPHDVLEDLFSRNGVSLSKKLWAYRRGFLSYRLDLYPELCEDTWEQYVTDFEYRWLRHINPKYRTWMEDKVTLKYVAAGFNEHLPAYYYFISCRAGENRVIPMMDRPPGFSGSVVDVLRLVRERGTVALKPDEGSHGEGFYKLSHVNGAYFLNDEPASAERVEAILRDPKNQYLVTEYLSLHPELKRIYPGAVNSVRITTFKRDGVRPEIGNAYLRIGSSRTGAVDNVVAGGFVAEVDVATGRFGDARTLVDNRLVRTSVHPDTGEPMEGTLPHWRLVCERVLAIAHAIPQLEYMGFDVAITEEGFKLLEVNRYPDYPRISRLTPETTSYLLQKIEDKKRFCDIEHDRSLFKLPRRSA